MNIKKNSPSIDLLVTAVCICLVSEYFLSIFTFVVLSFENILEYFLILEIPKIFHFHL